MDLVAGNARAPKHRTVHLIARRSQLAAEEVSHQLGVPPSRIAELADMGALYVGPVVDPAAVIAAASAEASGNEGIGASAFLAAGGTKPRRARRDSNVSIRLFTAAARKLLAARCGCATYKRKEKKNEEQGEIVEIKSSHGLYQRCNRFSLSSFIS